MHQLREGDAYHIVGWTPIKQVQVVIIHQLRGIKDALWGLGDVPVILASRALSSILAVQGGQIVLHSFWWCWSLHAKHF